MILHRGYKYTSFREDFNTVCEPSIIFDSGEKATSTVYLDRMWQWDYDKYHKLAIKHFGKPQQTLFGVDSDDLEKFLREYLEEQVILCRVETGVRQDTGYDWFRIDYKKVE